MKYSRYLLVFSNTWEVIDTQNHNKVVASGSRSEMKKKIQELCDGNQEEVAKAASF